MSVMSQMSVRMNSEEAYSHPIRAIHYSAPERKAGRAERKRRRSHRKEI